MRRVEAVTRKSASESDRRISACLCEREITAAAAAIFRPHRMQSVHKMRPIAADGVAWSVCLFVTFVQQEAAILWFVWPIEKHW